MKQKFVEATMCPESKIVLLAPLIFISALEFTSSSTINTVNNCPYPVWVGTLGQRKQNSWESWSTPMNGGFYLPNGAQQAFSLERGWAGIVWGRRNCDSNGGNCDSANCGSVQCNGRGGEPPITLAEFNLGQWNNLDFYDVSLVDGFNVPLRIQPQDSSCMSVTCSNDMNQGCPDHLKLWKDGRVVGCRSGISDQQKKGDPQFVGYAEQVCPTAYAFWNDDKKTTSCPGGDSTSTFDVIFCG